MDNRIEKIIKLDEQIDSMALQTTSAYMFGTKQNLSVVDKKILEYYKEMLDVVIDILKENNTKNIEVVDKILKDYKNSASRMIEDFIELLQYYSEFNEEIIQDELEILNKIYGNIMFDKELNQTVLIELADSYFRIGNEEKARKMLLDYIKQNPNEDEPYLYMQNWYMFYKKDYEKLAEVIDLAEENNHTLITDFGFDELINYYKKIGNIDKKEKYEKLYNKWKEKNVTINI